MNGHDKVVGVLLAYGADVNGPDGKGEPPLIWAINNGHEKIAELLLIYKADANASDCGGQAALMLAAQYGYDKAVEALLGHGADANARNRRESPPLMSAAERGHDKVVEMLLTHRANVNARERRDGMTPLMLAAKWGHDSVVKTLFAHGADVDVQDIYQKTALILASENGRLNIAQLLLDHGASASVEVIQDLLGKAQEAKHLHLMAALLQRLDKEEQQAHFFKAYANEDWWTMLAMITLRPQLTKEMKVLLAQHQKMVARADPQMAMTPFMQQLENLSPQQQAALPGRLDAMKEHIQEQTQETRTATQERIDAVVEDAPVEIAQMITSCNPSVDEKAFVKKMKKKAKGKSSSPMLMTPLAAMGLLMARSRPAQAVNRQPQTIRT